MSVFYLTMCIGFTYLIFRYVLRDFAVALDQQIPANEKIIDFAFAMHSRYVHGTGSSNTPCGAGLVCLSTKRAETLHKI